MYMYASKSELGYDPDIFYDYNPEKAKKLLAESAYRPGDPITLTYTSLVPNSRMIAAMVQRYLMKIGMTVRLQQLEAGVGQFAAAGLRFALPTSTTRMTDAGGGPLRLAPPGNARPEGSA